jgi:hypothetical protein
MIVSAAGRSQAIPDTTAPWTYYPLGLGDVWQYTVAIENRFGHHYTYALTREVVAIDTVFGRVYARLLTVAMNVPQMPEPPPDSLMVRARFDTIAARPIWRSGMLPENRYECRLDEAFPVEPDTTRSIACDAWAATVAGGYSLPLPHGGVATQKIVDVDHALDLTDSTTFASGIGVIARRWTYKVHGWETHLLAYARVAGIEYGTPIVAAEPPPAGRRPLSVAPNPTDGRAVVSFHLASAGLVRVTLHDVLGRELLVAYDGWLSAGDHRMPVEAAGLPPGVYLVRGVVDAIGTSVPVVVR